MNAGPARVLWSLSPIPSRQDFAHCIQLAHITDEWSQALSVVRELRLGRVFVAPLDIVIRRDLLPGDGGACQMPHPPREFV